MSFLEVPYSFTEIRLELIVAADVAPPGGRGVYERGFEDEVVCELRTVPLRGER